MEAGELNTVSLNIYPPHMRLGHCFLHNDSIPLGVCGVDQGVCSAQSHSADQVSGGNGNKAALSGSLRADPNSAELRRLFWKIFPIQLPVAIQPDS